MSAAVRARLRVLLVVSSAKLAGTERHVVELAAGLRTAGVEAEVVCEPGGDGLDDVLIGRRVPVYRLRLTGPGLAPSIVRLARLSRGFDLLHAHLTHAAAAAVAAGALAHRPVLETRHFVELAHEGRGPCRRAVGRVRRQAINAGITRTLAPSRAVLERAGRKAVLVPHGIGLLPTPRRRSASGGRVVTVGRLELGRDHDLALRAFAIAARRLPRDASLVIVGDGSKRARLEALAGDLGIGDRVRFTGRIPEVGGELFRADTYLSPATEAFGLAALEAMASGLPVVGVARGGLLDLVEHEHTGLLVEPTPSALAEAMVRLACDTAAGIEMGAAGLRRAGEEFSVEQMVRRTVDAYNVVANRHRVGPDFLLRTAVSREGSAK